MARPHWSRRFRRMVVATGFAALAAWLPSAASRSQEMPASLIADQVSYNRDTRVLIASGDVEVLYQGRVLHATRITYDEAANSIHAEGPLILTDPGNGGVLLADTATLTPDLTHGLISSARLLIAGKMQLAAAEVRRNGERYATLYNTVASSCTICAGDQTPTWALRASRVTRDAAERRIYFQNARLELFGLPVGYLPRLSIPEPGVTRATGVLVPSFLQSNIFGFGVKVPYYKTLGPAADMTLTPFITSKGAKLLEGQYRRRFDDGGFDLSGVLAIDDGLDGVTDGIRGTVAALGGFNLGNGFKADFDLALVSDKSFLAQFDYSDADRLTSTAGIHRTGSDQYIDLDTVAFQSLRDDEDDATIPFVLPEFDFRQLIYTPGIGGRLGINAQSLGITRLQGRDMFRAGGSVDWRNDWVLQHGLLASSTFAADVDAYEVWDDPGEDGFHARAVPTASVELRWPLIRTTARAAHVIEPVVQVIGSGAIGDADVPNEDSQLPEFDDTNLYSLNRFPGEDRLETGLRANVGISYTRQDPAGWSLGVTVGRVLRTEPDNQFTQGTGLSGRFSDYVGAVSLDLASGLTIVNRALFDPSFGFQRSEFALAYDGERGAMRAAYVYLRQDDSDPVVGPQPETNEIALDARYRVRPNWEVRGLWRYDVATSSNLRAGAGLTYGNECTEFDLSVSRRYTSSTNVPPSTSIGFALKLAGIGQDGQRSWPARVCTARGI